MARDALLVLARVLLAQLFVPSGLKTLGNIEGSAAYFASLGLPLPTMAAWGTGLFELIAGLLVLIGLLLRPAAASLAAFSIAAGFIGHYGQGGGDATLAFLHQQMLMKDIAIAGGFIALMLAGAGGWSVDSRRGG